MKLVEDDVDDMKNDKVGPQVTARSRRDVMKMGVSAAMVMLNSQRGLARGPVPRPGLMPQTGWKNDANRGTDRWMTRLARSLDM
jgi:hypothetical protein